MRNVCFFDVGRWEIRLKIEVGNDAERDVISGLILERNWGIFWMVFGRCRDVEARVEN